METNEADNEENKIIPVVPQVQDDGTNRTFRRRTFISFGIFAILNMAGILGWRWLRRQPNDHGALKPLRNVLDANEKVNTNFFSDYHLAKEYPKEEALKEVRVNGDAGINEDFDINYWSLTVQRHHEAASDDDLELSMNDIKALPKHELIFDFKCIEGWDMVTHWGG